MWIETWLAVIESKETKIDSQDQENMDTINKAFKNNREGDPNSLLNQKEGPVKDAWDNLSKKFPMNRVRGLDLEDGTRQKRSTTFSVDFVYDKLWDLANEEKKWKDWDPYKIKNTQELLHHYGLYDKEKFPSINGEDWDWNSNIDGQIGSGTKDAIAKWNDRYGDIFDKNVTIS